MRTCRLNFVYILCALILTGISACAVTSTIMIFRGEATYVGSRVIGSIFCVFICLVALTYLISAVTMICHFFYYKKQAFLLTEHGIENTLTCTVFLAFIIIMPVKMIPWSAVTSYNVNNEICTVKVDKKIIQACPVTRQILSARGYSFCRSFTSPKFTESDLNEYLKYISVK